MQGVCGRVAPPGLSPGAFLSAIGPSVGEREVRHLFLSEGRTGRRGTMAAPREAAGCAAEGRRGAARRSLCIWLA